MMALVSADAAKESEADRLASSEAERFIITVLVEAEADSLTLPLSETD
ncbi:MAG: hypothetical protein MR671_04705 [Clostridiales bacterium]|nr:hypothetical protein [Clostridiales bacterium]